MSSRDVIPSASNFSNAEIVEDISKTEVSVRLLNTPLRPSASCSTLKALFVVMPVRSVTRSTTCPMVKSATGPTTSPAELVISASSASSRSRASAIFSFTKLVTALAMLSPNSSNTASTETFLANICSASCPSVTGGPSEFVTSVECVTTAAGTNSYNEGTMNSMPRSMAFPTVT